MSAEIVLVQLLGSDAFTAQLLVLVIGSAVESTSQLAILVCYQPGKPRSRVKVESTHTHWQEWAEPGLHLILEQGDEFDTPQREQE